MDQNTESATDSEHSQNAQNAPKPPIPLPRELVLLIRTKHQLKKKLNRDVNNKELYLQFKALERNIRNLVRYLKTIPPQQSEDDIIPGCIRLEEPPREKEKKIDFTSDDWF